MILPGRFTASKHFALKAVLLLALLVIHFLERQQTGKTMPQKGPQFYSYSDGYPTSYQNSLAIMAGKGFCRLSLPTADCPEARPIIEFVRLQRPEISRNEFESYVRSPQATTEPCAEWESTRILDIYLTAFIWKVFGISWGIYYTVASLASTASCFFVFLIARKLSGSYWAGLLSALLFFASPFEKQYTIRSLRDISPLWFATLAFGFFICATGNWRSSKWHYASFFVLGILAMIGKGWRVDALLLVPYLLFGLIIFLIGCRRGWKQIVAGGCLFLLGCWSTDRAISELWPGGDQGSGIVFHTALYGDSSRCNFMGLENSFQIPRDDVQTFFNAFCYRHVDNPPKPFVPASPVYAAICRDMYITSLKYHLHQYLWSWPGFYIKALSAFTEAEQLQGESLAELHESRLPWLLPIYQFCLDPLIRILPFFYLVGAIALLVMGRDKLRGAWLVLFSLYYGIVWFAILPEQKHLGQLLLPLAVTGGIGLWSIGRLAGLLLFTMDPGVQRLSIFRPLRAVGWGAITATLVWLVACWLTYPYSTRHRNSLLNEIIQAAARGVDAPDTIKDSGVFSVWIDPKETSGQEGYLLSIEASHEPGFLTCRHVHFPAPSDIDPTGILGRVFVTRHRLHPDRLQYFAVSCLQARNPADIRPYACTVVLPPGSRIYGCRKLDLSSWNKLPFSTVFFDQEDSPGSPPVGRFSALDMPIDPYIPRYVFNNFSSETVYDYPWRITTIAGLPFDQNYSFPGLRPERLAAARDSAGLHILRSPQTLEDLSQAALPLESLKPASGVHRSIRNNGVLFQFPSAACSLVASYPPLGVPTPGVYLFKVKFQQRGSGDLVLKAVRSERKEPLKQRCLPQREGDSSVKYLELILESGNLIELEFSNQLSMEHAGCEFLIQEVQAYREKNPLWDLVR